MNNKSNYQIGDLDKTASIKKFQKLNKKEQMYLINYYYWFVLILLALKNI